MHACRLAGRRSRGRRAPCAAVLSRASCLLLCSGHPGLRLRPRAAADVPVAHDVHVGVHNRGVAVRDGASARCPPLLLRCAVRHCGADVDVLQDPQPAKIFDFGNGASQPRIACGLGNEDRGTVNQMEFTIDNTPATTDVVTIVTPETLPKARSLWCRARAHVAPHLLHRACVAASSATLRVALLRAAPRFSECWCACACSRGGSTSPCRTTRRPAWAPSFGTPT